MIQILDKTIIRVGAFFVLSLSGVKIKVDNRRFPKSGCREA